MPAYRHLTRVSIAVYRRAESMYGADGNLIIWQTMSPPLWRGKARLGASHVTRGLYHRDNYWRQTIRSETMRRRFIGIVGELFGENVSM